MIYLGFTSTVNPDSTITLADSTGATNTSSDIEMLLDFLLTADKDTLKAAWDLDQFCAPLLRLMGKDVCRELLGDNHRAQFGSYRVFYIPDRVLGLHKGGFDISIYGLQQYFPDAETPATVAELAQQGNRFLAALAKAQINPRKLTSPIAIYEDALLEHFHMPTAADVPVEATGCLDYALKCASRLWISNYQVGHWLEGECFDYDLSAAFPFEASRLLDFRKAQFLFSETERLDAQWGFVRGMVTITSSVSPLVTTAKDGTIISPMGTWEDYLTLDEVRAIRKWGIGDFKMLDGWFIKFPFAVKPLSLLMSRLYQQRALDPVLDGFSKRVANGLIGKMLEVFADGNYGKYFNPIWHSIVTARVRLRVADFIYSHKVEANLIHVGVDGCLLDRDLGLSGAKVMGQWRYKGSEPSIVLSPGAVFTPSKHPKGLDYSTLRNTIAAHPNRSRYEVQLPHRVTLTGAVNDGRLDLLGKERPEPEFMDLVLAKYEQDRLYDKFPKNGRELLEQRFLSHPVVLA